MHVNELINDIKYVLYPSVCFNEWYFFNVANKMKCYSPVTFIFLNLRDIFFLLSQEKAAEREVPSKVFFTLSSRATGLKLGCV